MLLEFYRAAAWRIDEVKRSTKLSPNERRSALHHLELIFEPAPALHGLALLASWRPVPRLTDDATWDEWVNRVLSNDIPDEWYGSSDKPRARRARAARDARKAAQAAAEAKAMVG